MFISWAAVSLLLLLLLVHPGFVPPRFGAPSQSSPSYLVLFPVPAPCGNRPAWEVRSIDPFLPSSVVIVSQPPCSHAHERARAPGMSLSRADVVTRPLCIHLHPHAHSEPPLADSVRPVSTRLGPWIFQRETDLPSRLAVLTGLGQVTNTALNEPASLLGTKQLLLPDQSRGK